ncbi:MULTISPECIES: EAL domain-containing protein [Pseudomonas]|nr:MULTISPECIES: EAL domain-containing protein [Pseudomonas]MBA1246597.1 EAL domain-containing protein [Pseudomonas zeshuii]QEU27274.1 EAL domain-containing protein [Pseudomonas luteola]
MSSLASIVSPCHAQGKLVMAEDVDTEEKLNAVIQG